MMSSWSDPDSTSVSTSKTLNLSFLWFNERSGFQNHDKYKQPHCNPNENLI